MATVDLPAPPFSLPTTMMCAMPLVPVVPGRRIGGQTGEGKATGP